MRLAGAIAAALFAAATGVPGHLGPPAPAQVRRVVTLAPSLSEIVLALGAGERLTGVTRFDDDPRTAKVPRIGGYNDPEPEAVLRARPDVVLAQPAPGNRGPVETLARLGVPVELYPLGTLEEIEGALRGVARVLGLPGRGEQEVLRLEAARAEARRAARTAARPRTLLVFGLDPLVVAGERGFAGQLLRDAGGENAAGAGTPSFFRLSAEAAVAARPELVVLCGVESPRGRPVVPGLERVRTVPLRSTALLHPGPRVAEALADLGAALRP